MCARSGDLQTLRGLPPDIAAIKRNEREGDFVYRRAVAELYSGDFRPLEVMMWKDLLHQVESAIDRCEDVANRSSQWWRSSDDATPSSSSSRSPSLFDYINGFHDAANSIATVVSTRVLSPHQAVAWAAFFNFAAFIVFGTKVADTIAKRREARTSSRNAVDLRRAASARSSGT